MNSKILTVYLKEMRDMVRDKRAVIAALSFAFISPAIILMISLLTQEEGDVYDKPVIAVSGVDYAPGLVTFLENNDYKVEPVDDLNGVPSSLPDDSSAMIVVEADFQADVAKGVPADVILYTSGTSQGKIARGKKIFTLLQNFSLHIAGARLQTRGIPGVLVSPFKLQERDLAPESFFAQYISDSIILMLIFAPFAVSMGVAIDTLAGERERQSLQSLMAQPVSGKSLVLGKWMMVTTFAVVGTVMACATFFLTLELMPDDKFPVSMHVSPYTVLLVLLQMVPMAMLVASLQLFVSIQVKSFKEGQTYMSMVMLAPMVVGYIKIFGSDKLPSFVQKMPIFAHMDSIGDILFNNRLTAEPFVFSMLSSMIGFAVFLWLTSRAVDNERLLDEA